MDVITLSCNDHFGSYMSRIVRQLVRDMDFWESVLVRGFDPFMWEKNWVRFKQCSCIFYSVSNVTWIWPNSKHLFVEREESTYLKFLFLHEWRILHSYSFHETLKFSQRRKLVYFFARRMRCTKQHNSYPIMGYRYLVPDFIPRLSCGEREWERAR